MGSEVVILPVICIFFYMMIKTISNNKLRKHLADKALKGEELKQLFSDIDQTSSVGLNTFKIGLFLLVIGIDILIVDSFNLYDEMAASVFFLSGGIILILADKLEALFRK